MRRLLRIAILVGLAFFVFWLFKTPAGPSVEAGTTVVLDLAGTYTEASEPPLFARFVQDGARPFAALLSDMRKASRDDRVDAVILRIRPLGIGWAKAQELRSAIRALTEAGRRTVAYLEVATFGANLEFFVASAAEEVFLAPATRAPLVGLAAEYLFLGGLWGKLGIEFDVERIGRYKTAADAFTGTEMSDAHREMANALLDSIDEQFVGGIAQGRGLEPSFVRDSIDRAPVTPAEMEALGLTDGMKFYDEVVAHLGGEPVMAGADYANVDPSEVGFTPVANFALVYGSGSVVQGRGSQSPGGGRVLSSETVGQALIDAADDESIRAIIFRIDSPGGSALASDIVWRATQLARQRGKPLVASFSDVAASGGYYVACGADAIVASPGSLTGSIGVVSLRPILGGLFDKLGIGFESLTRGAHADMLLSARPLSEGSRERMGEEVESIYDLFVERVADGRSLEVEKVDSLGQGRVWTGAQALEIGLVDALGGLHDAVGRAKEEIGLDADADVALVPYPPPKSLAEQIGEAMQLSVAATPSLPIPSLLARVQQWVAALGDAGPVLLPPVVFEIR